MAECSVLSDGLASLAVDGLTARVRPQVQNRLGKNNHNTRENVTTQLPQPLPPKYPDGLTVSLNPRTEITGMWLTASNKLWVKYNPPGAYVDYLKLFGNDGKELGRWRGNVVPERLFMTCADDALLSICNWQWIKPSGESGCLNNALNTWARCSKSFSPLYVLCCTAVKREYLILHRLDVVSRDPLNVKLTVVCKVLPRFPLPDGFDVSSCGTLICLNYIERVDIYSIDNPTTITKIVSGDESNIDLSRFDEDTQGFHFIHVFFFHQHGGDTLIASINCLQDQQLQTYLASVFEIDHEDGFLVKRMVTYDTSDSDPTTYSIHGPSGTLRLRCFRGNISVIEQ